MTFYLKLIWYIINGDNMRKKFVLMIMSVISGIAFTLYFLNNETFYAKEDYLIYALQAGAYKNYDNAQKVNIGVPSVIIKEDGLYKIYIGIYKKEENINKMLEYFKNKGINPYLKSIKVNKELYNDIDALESLFSNTNHYDNLNESILNLFSEVYYE